MFSFHLLPSSTQIGWHTNYTRRNLWFPFPTPPNPSPPALSVWIWEHATRPRSCSRPSGAPWRRKGSKEWCTTNLSPIREAVEELLCSKQKLRITNQFEDTTEPGRNTCCFMNSVNASKNIMLNHRDASMFWYRYHFTLPWAFILSGQNTSCSSPSRLKFVSDQWIQLGRFSFVNQD